MNRDSPRNFIQHPVGWKNAVVGASWLLWELGSSLPGRGRHWEKGIIMEEVDYNEELGCRGTVLGIKQDKNFQKRCKNRLCPLNMCVYIHTYTHRHTHTHM